MRLPRCAQRRSPRLSPRADELVRHAAGARVDVAEGERADRAGSVGILETDAIGTTAK